MAYFAILHVNVPLMRGRLLCRDTFDVTRCPLIRGFTILILETVVMTTTSVINIVQALILMQHANQMYTQVSMAFIVMIAYDARNKFHYCMSKFFQV